MHPCAVVNDVRRRQRSTPHMAHHVITLRYNICSAFLFYMLVTVARHQHSVTGYRARIVAGCKHEAFRNSCQAQHCRFLPRRTRFFRQKHASTSSFSITILPSSPSRLPRSTSVKGLSRCHRDRKLRPCTYACAVALPWKTRNAGTRKISCRSITRYRIHVSVHVRGYPLFSSHRAFSSSHCRLRKTTTSSPTVFFVKFMSFL